MIVYYQQHNSRDFHTLIEDIALHLHKTQNAILCVDGNDMPSVADCDLLIHYPETDTFKGITFADRQNKLTNFFERRNNANDLLLNSQYANTNLALYNKLGYKFRYKPSIYTPSYPNISLEGYYTKRINNTTFIDKFIFRGNVHLANRTSADLLKGYEYFEGHDNINTLEYFDELTKYKVGLSIPGLGELCYRDVEYMAIGIPMMKFEYVTQLNPPLIPNHHYISIDRIDSEEDRNFNGGVIGAERQGGEKYVTQYKKRFEEVKDDTEFLNFISKNAREYYETYLHPSTRLQHILNLLEID